MNPWRTGVAAACVALWAWGAARAEPPMWRVTGSKGSAVLFGSIHLLPAGLDWPSVALTEAVAKADELWFEIPIGGKDDLRAARLLLAEGSLPEGDTLGAHLPPDMMKRLATDAAAVGLVPASLAGMRPWLADATLSVAEDARHGALASEGVERRIDALAPATTRRRALETAADQIAVLAKGSMAEQVDLLGVTLDEIEHKPRIYQALVKAWVEGDIPALRRETLDPLRAASPRAYDQLITRRNRRWALEIEHRLRRGGAIFVVVGIGHLIGSQSVPDLLRADGLSVDGPSD